MASPLAGMKKKVGPLPMWAWIVIVGGTIGAYMLYRSNKSSSTTAAGANPNTVDPSSPVGATYAEEAKDQALGIDPLTNQTYAQEQAASAAGDAGTSGGGGSSGSGSTGATESTDATSAELGIIESELAALQGGGVTDGATPSGSFAGEVGDVASGVSSLAALAALFAPVPATSQGKSSKPSLKGAGAKRAPSGATKPKAPKGFTVKGLGSGNWEFVPVKTRKSNGSGSAAHASHSGGAAVQPVSRKTKHTTTTYKPKPKTPPKPTRVRGHKHHGP